METNENFILSLKRDGYIKTEALAEAFLEIDRKKFVPEDLKENAYENIPLPIGFGQTISQPLTVAFLIELLSPKRGEKILDVGSGSGWQASLIAHMVQSEEKNKFPQVVSVERIPELKKYAEKNIEKFGFIKSGLVRVINGDGVRDGIQFSPYDGIIAAASGDRIPEEWKDQIKVGGRIVAPVKDSILIIEKTGPDEYSEKKYFGFTFVPLISDKK